MKGKLVALLGGVLGLGAVGAASAADLAVKAPPPPPPAPVWSWTGFYIGGHVGGYWSDESAAVDTLPFPGFGTPAIVGAGLAGFGLIPTAHNLNQSGVLGGLYLGYNWQTGPWVFGLEGDFSYLGQTSTSVAPSIETFSGLNSTRGLVTVSDNSHWLGTVRGRIGYAWNSFMGYVTGGAAFTDGSHNLTVVPTGAGLAGWPGGSVGFNSNQVGWVAGVGGEFLVANNWMFRVEYLHYGFGGTDGTLPVVADTCTVSANCRFVGRSSDLNIDTVRVGIAYKFGGPVVARY
jgi:outer membrane immunogenic protein